MTTFHSFLWLSNIPLYIYPTMRYHLIPVSTTIVKKTRNNKCWQELGEKGTLAHCMEFPQKIKNRTTILSSNSTPRYLTKENKNTNSKRYKYPSVHRIIIYNNQDMKAM